MVFRKLPSVANIEFLKLVWDNDAPCLHTDPEVFFPVSADPESFQAKWAKSVCARCPVRIDCLHNALEANDQHAVLGGLTWSERVPLRRKMMGAKAA